MPSTMELKNWNLIDTAFPDGTKTLNVKPQIGYGQVLIEAGQDDLIVVVARYDGSGVETISVPYEALAPQPGA